MLYYCNTSLLRTHQKLMRGCWPRTSKSYTRKGHTTKYFHVDVEFFLAGCNSLTDKGTPYSPSAPQNDTHYCTK